MSETARDTTRIRFPPSFVPRLQRLVGRLSAERARCEGAGGGALEGGGDEFVGHRAWRPGDELRDLDWNLLARFDEPFVRVHRREAGERWALLLDTSASMGLGRPPKLQRAAEVASGLAFVGRAAGAHVRLHAMRDGEPVSRGLRSPAELRGWLAFLEGLRAAGTGGLRPLLERIPARCERVFLIGDLFDLAPAEAIALGRPGRGVDVVRVLAPRELAPGAEHLQVEWLDPETGEHLDVALDGDVRRRYERVLARHLEDWRATCARHRVAHGAWSSARPFEDLVRGVLLR